jgi:hypothetical protein
MTPALWVLLGELEHQELLGEAEAQEVEPWAVKDWKKWPTTPGRIAKSRAPMVVTVVWRLKRMHEQKVPKEEQEPDLRLLKAILAAGANPDIPDWNGDYALHHAPPGVIVELLLSHGADVNVQDGEDSWTPLALSIEREEYDKAESILQKRPRLDLRDLLGNTVHEKAFGEGRALIERYAARFGLAC